MRVTGEPSILSIKFVWYPCKMESFTVNVKRRYIVHRCPANRDLHFARPQNPAEKTSVRVRTSTWRTPWKDIFSRLLFCTTFIFRVGFSSPLFYMSKYDFIAFTVSVKSAKRRSQVVPQSCTCEMSISLVKWQFSRLTSSVNTYITASLVGRFFETFILQD
jgi:hypothetical protein